MALAFKDYTYPSGKVVQVQGYEPIYHDVLVECGLSEDEIVVGIENVPIIPYPFEGKGHMYFPDIYLPRYNMIVEIKSDYTYERHKEKTHCKIEATRQQGYIARLVVYNQKGECVKTITLCPEH